MNQPTLFEHAGAAERVGERINAVTDTEVRGALWAIWVLAVHGGAEPAGMARNWFFMRRIVPLINRLDPASTVYLSERWKQDGYPPCLVHRCADVPALLWALRQLAFGAEADALAALEEAA